MRLILTAAIAVLLLAVPVLASEVGVEARDPVTDAFFSALHPYSACAGPLTPREIALEVVNLGADTDTYRLSLSLPKDWEGQIKPDITLASGERQRLALLVINPPAPWNVLPGNYTVTVRAKSLTDGRHKAEVSVPVQVLSCYRLEIEPLAAAQSACEERAIPEFKFRVTNAGKWDERALFKATVAGAETTQELSLLPGETKVVAYTPAAAVRGENRINASVNSLVSYANASTTAVVTRDNCYDFSAALQPADQGVCIGKRASSTLVLTNNAGNDTYTIEAPGFLAVQNRTVALATGQQKQIELTGAPPQVGSRPLTVTVTPSAAPQERKELAGSLTGNECRAVAVSLNQTGAAEACSGDVLTFTAMVKNTGAVRDTVTLNSSHGSLGLSQVTLEPGENRNLTLTVPTAGMTGERTFTVSAKGLPGNDGSRGQDQASARAEIALCYAAQLTATPRNHTACGCESASYTLTAENVGTKSDGYRLSLGNQTKNLILAPRERQSLPFSVPVPCDAPAGVQQLTARLVSERYDAEQAVSLTVPPFGACYQAALADGKVKQVEIARASAFPVRLENTGLATQNFTLSVEGPSWIYPQPEFVSLGPKSATDIYVYAVPPLGTPVSNHTATLRATAAHSQASLELRIRVVKEITELELPLNLTSGLPLTGQFLAIPADVRVVAAGAVAAFAIALLALRFFVFRKKLPPVVA